MTEILHILRLRLLHLKLYTLRVPGFKRGGRKSNLSCQNLFPVCHGTQLKINPRHRTGSPPQSERSTSDLSKSARHVHAPSSYTRPQYRTLPVLGPSQRPALRLVPVRPRGEPLSDGPGCGCAVRGACSLEWGFGSARLL